MQHLLIGRFDARFASGRISNEPYCQRMRVIVVGSDLSVDEVEKICATTYARMQQM